MRRRAEPSRPRRGFALVLVLGLVALVGVLGTGSLGEALFDETLAGSRVLQQRAASLSDLGVADAMQRLNAPVLPADGTRELRPVADQQESTVVSLRGIGTAALPVGYSLGQFVAHRFAIESTGRGPRGTRFVQVQGALRVLPGGTAPAPAAAQSP